MILKFHPQFLFLLRRLVVRPLGSALRLFGGGKERRNSPETRRTPSSPNNLDTEH